MQNIKIHWAKFHLTMQPLNICRDHLQQLKNTLNDLSNNINTLARLRSSGTQEGTIIVTTAMIEGLKSIIKEFSSLDHEQSILQALKQKIEVIKDSLKKAKDPSETDQSISRFLEQFNSIDAEESMIDTEIKDLSDKSSNLIRIVKKIISNLNSKIKQKRNIFNIKTGLLNEFKVAIYDCNLIATSLETHLNSTYRELTNMEYNLKYFLSKR